MADSKEVEQPATPEIDEQPRLNFPVVGIGASAGGMEAFREFLQALPPDCGMAFVYVQHLDPTHESMLVDILGRSTRMPLAAAVEGMGVEPNHVYVIPPNKTLVISGGVLSLRPRLERAGEHLPIDFFLRSLAKDQRSKAIAVVLSGTSSDGALGLLEVKHAGGITFAQDETAKYPGMPQHAIETGAVDFVFSPGGIARELARIARHPYVSSKQPEETEFSRPGADEVPDGILGLLRAAKGTDFSSYRHSTLKRRIARRMALNRIDSIQDYLGLVDKNPAELEALYEDVLIKVTAFFRDPPVFDALKETVIAALLEGRPPDKPMRVWIPGCATGEEAYSVAICFLEALSERKSNIPVQIFATDANERSVTMARSGLYLENISVDVSPERLQRFFTHVNGHYQISKAVRDLCVFARHDLTKDPPFSMLDLISCRNVLIYMASSLQKRIIPVFHYALRPSGYLMLGGSESLAGFHELFNVVDRAHRIYIKNPIRSTHMFDVPETPTLDRNNAESPLMAATLEREREADRLAFVRYGHAGVVVNESGTIVQFKGDTVPFLRPPGGDGNFEIETLAREELRTPLSNALRQAAATGQTQRSTGLEIRLDKDERRKVNIEVHPMRLPSRVRYFLVLFDMPFALSAPPAVAAEPSAEADRREIARLQQQLDASTEYLQAVIDELKASQEELLSNNEELQSINEEIETGKEELQSANEELTTINETRNAELGQTNADLHNLIDAVQIPIVVLGAEKRIRFFTPAAGRVFNFIPTDVGRPLTDIRATLGSEDVSGFIDETVRQRITREAEVTDQHGNWYLMRAHPYKTPQGETEGAVLVLFDIGNRKRAEQERERLINSLENERAKLERIIEQMPSGVVVAEAPSGKIMLSNRQVEQIMGHPILPVGHPDEQTQYKGFHRDGHPYSPGDWPLARSLRRGEVINNEEIEYVRGDGTRFTMRASSAPIRDRESNIIAAVLVFDEITEQKILQERLAQSQRLETIGRLAGGIAHDFNNLLTVISGYTQLVHDDPHLKRHLRKELETVLGAANRAATLTSQLLAFSRRQVIQPRVIDINPLVAAMDRLLRRLVGENIELRTELCAEPCVVEADPGQIEQIVMNLVANARDAIQGEGTITVETGGVELQDDQELGTGEFVRISVSDTGAGMDDETKRHLFEPFYTTKGLGHGTGLGLSSVYGAVKQNRGGMRVESEAGKGSRFEIYLPRVHGEPESEEEEARQAAARGSETVLVVEDEPRVRTLARRYLERLGYRVLEAENGAEALRTYETHRGVISLLVTDIVMPKMDGQELAKRLRERQPGLKVLYTSGYPEHVMAKGGILDPDAEFISKPFNGDDLARKVHSIINGQ